MTSDMHDTNGDRAAQGYEMGKASASWVFDGSTTHDTYDRFLTGYDKGDPEVMDPCFSIGEMAGESAVELGIEGYEDEYLEGFYEGYWDTLVDVASRALSAER